MKSMFKMVGCAVIAAALLGCAGTDFKRPDAGKLTVGRSSSSQVTQVMGNPAQTGEVMRNGEKLKVHRYVYADGVGKGKYPGVTPARALVYVTHNDVVVAEEFVSSFPNDATDFDDGKVSKIVKGKTTKSDVAALLGKPNGEAVYPYVKAKDQNAVIYSYAHVTGNAFNLKAYSKTLVVSFDKADTVADIEFVSNGQM